MSHLWTRLRPGVLLLTGLLPALTLTPGSAGGQMLEGVVRAADSGAGLAGATVRQELGGGSFRAVRSERTGAFRLDLEGNPPYEIRIQRLGFGEWAQTLEAVPDSLLEVTLERRPVELDEIRAEVDREPIRIELPRQRLIITEEGAYNTSPRRAHDNCNAVVLDSVVIRSPYHLEDLLTPPFDMNLIDTGPYLAKDHYQNSTIPNPRIRRESYPCGLHRYGHTFRHRVNLPEVDLPVTPATTLAPRWERPLAATPQATAPGPDGSLSVWLDDHVLHLDAAGEERGSLEIDVPVWPDQKVPMGWLGDTLWVA
ncbi:MAG: carboxypeptidase regulatory-like domain-containing protein, partial [Gemmatimonadales bacterium]